MSAPAKGRPRREAIISLVPPGRTVVEVGCDHGHTAAALGAIGTERRVHRLPRRSDLRLVVADGLRPFRKVEVAVIAGIGAAQIARVLDLGPRPDVAILHAPDRPATLRRWCAEHGWRIEAERLAHEGRRFAEVMRVVPGQEPHEGLTLAFGPRLIDDPLLLPHTRQLHGYWSSVLERVRDHSPGKAAEARSWLSFLEAVLAEHPDPPPQVDRSGSQL